MKVLVLEHRWDTLDNEGSDIQIFGENNIEAARIAMQESVDAVKKEYRKLDGSDPWEDDFTWSGENEVHLGFVTYPFSPCVVYSWEIYEREVQ